MKNSRALRLFVAGSAAAFAFAIAAPASAGEHNLYGTIGLGNESVETSFSDLSPTGPVVSVAVGDTFYNNGDLSVSVELGATAGKVEASKKEVSCDPFFCGYTEWVTRTDSTDWSASAVVRVSDDVGPFVVSLSGGVAVSSFKQSFEYTNDGGFPPFSWNSERRAIGPTWGALVSYPLTSSSAVTLSFTRTDLTAESWGGNSQEITTERWSVSYGRVF